MMMRRHLRTDRRVHYTLSPRQYQTIRALSPGETRNSFLPRVSAALKLAAPVGGVTDQLVDPVTDKILLEVAA